MLVAGDSDDVESIRALLATLPSGAYGQVFIESDERAPRVDLRPPARVAVTYLAASESRPHHGGTEPTTTATGTLLADAVASWIEEWMPHEPHLDRIISIWVGGRHNAPLNELCRTLPTPPGRL